MSHDKKNQKSTTESGWLYRGNENILSRGSSILPSDALGMTGIHSYLDSAKYECDRAMNMDRGGLDPNYFPKSFCDIYINDSHE